MAEGLCGSAIPWMLADGCSSFRMMALEFEGHAEVESVESRYLLQDHRLVDDAVRECVCRGRGTNTRPLPQP